MNLHRLAIFIALTLPGLLPATGSVHAQNQALDLSRNRDVDLSPGMRENLETIGRYADTVNRRLAGHDTNGAASADSPRRFEQIADPFEVSPQLRESGKNKAFTGLPDAGRLELQRQIEVRALLLIANRRVAQLAIRDKDLITVHDRELLDLGELGVFEVRIERDAVSLFNPSMPQATKLILR